MTSRVVQLVSGILVHMILTRVLGSETYGLFGLLLGILVIVQGYIFGSCQIATVTLIVRYSVQYKMVIRAILVRFAPVAIMLAILFSIFAPLVGEWLGDTRLVAGLHLIAFSIPIYTCFIIYYSSLNGLRLYTRQSTVQILLNLSRVSLVAIFASVSLEYALAGYIFAALISAVAAGILLRGPSDDCKVEISWGDVLKTSQVSALFSMASMFWLQLDYLLLKAHEIPATALGEYVAVSNLGKMPYLILVSITAAALPILSNTSLTESKSAQLSFRQALRLLFIFGSSAIVFLAIDPHRLVVLLFPEEYSSMAHLLPWIALAVLLFTVINFVTTIAIANDKRLVATIVIAICLALLIMLSHLLINGRGAAGVVMAMLASVVITLAMLVLNNLKLIAKILPLNSLLRCVFTTSAVLLIFSYFNSNSLSILFTIPLGLISFGLGLIATGEFTMREFRQFRNMLNGFD